MPIIAGNGLPVGAKKNLALRSGLFELVDAKFKRGLTDKKYTLREILESGNCEVLLPERKKFYKYVKDQIQNENPKINIFQYSLFILAGLLYIPPIVTGFYRSGFVTADTSLTGETHHSLIIHNYSVVWGDYFVPFIITTCIAGVFPLIVLLSKIKEDKKKISDLLDSVEAERDDTISEHKLISCFFTLCEVLYKIRVAKASQDSELQRQDILQDLFTICQKYNIEYVKITKNPYVKIYQLSLDELDSNLREYLLSESFSGITKNIICKIQEHITDLKKKALLNPGCKKISANFERALCNDSLTKNKVLDIISDFCIEKIDVREDPLPVPIFLTRDLDLIGVREALFEYWGDLDPTELVIHYTIDFNYLSSSILIKYSERHPKEFYQQESCLVRKPDLRQAPALGYTPQPILPHTSYLEQTSSRRAVP